MKKFNKLFILTAALFTIMLTGCGNNTDPKKPDDPPIEEPNENPTDLPWIS